MSVLEQIATASTSGVAEQLVDGPATRHAELGAELRALSACAS